MGGWGGWGVPIPVNQACLQEGSRVGRARDRGGAVKSESREWGPVSAHAGRRAREEGCPVVCAGCQEWGGPVLAWVLAAPGKESEE